MPGKGGVLSGVAVMADDHGEDLAISRAATRLVVLLCVLVFVLEGTDIQLLAFSAPVLLKEWGLRQVDLAPALAAASVGMIAGSVLGGILGDIFGRRMVMLVSVFSFGLCAMLSGMAVNLRYLELLRLLGGLGFGAIFPSVFSLVSEFTPPDLRGRYVTITTLGVPLGSMVGALGVGWTLPLFGWRICFYAAGALTLAVCLLLFMKLPESPAYLKTRAVRQRLAETGQPATSGPSPEISQRGMRSSLRGVFQAGYERRTFGLWIVSFALGYVNYAFSHWGPTMLTMSGLSLRISIMSNFFVGLFMAIAPLAMAWGLARFGSRTSMLTGIGMYALAAILFGAVLPRFPNESELVRTAAVMAALSLIGFAVGATTSGLYALSAYAYPPECRSTGSGLSTAVGRLGSAATAFGSAIVLGRAGGGPTGIVEIAVGCLAVAAVSTFVIDSHIAASPGARVI